LASESARDIASYNKRAAEALPYLLVVIDEALDLVLDGGKDLLRSLKTIAMRGRSAGVILWCATQHAAAITGLPRVVNVNLTTRLVFRVADRSAADTAGCPGAEAIPRDRPGRLLAKVDSGPQELQAYWLADNELRALARAVSRDVQSGPALTEQESALVHYALDSLDGAFIIGKLAAAEVCDLSKYRIEQLGKLWERRGWLTRPQHATDARKVTPQLAALTGR